jgi:glycine cleavage system H protein
MSKVPEGLKYTKEHEWTRVEGGLVVVGITDHAQEALGDVVFLELPETGRKIRQGAPFGVVESVKAVSDLYAPLDGEIVEINAELVQKPEALNKDAYANWLVKVKPSKASDVDALLDHAAYTDFLKNEAK